MADTPEKVLQRRGYVIAIEGMESVGKGEIARAVQTFLAEKKIESEVLRKFHDTYAGRKIRQTLLDPAENEHATEEVLDPRTEIHLYVAALGELYAKKIKKMREQGKSVIIPGYRMSVIGYQGFGDLYGDSSELARIVEELNLATEGERPDLTFVIDQQAEKAFTYANMENMRYLHRHKRDLSYYERVSEGFRNAAYRDRKRGVVYIPEVKSRKRRGVSDEKMLEVQIRRVVDAVEKIVLPDRGREYDPGKDAEEGQGSRQEIFSRASVYQEERGLWL